MLKKLCPNKFTTSIALAFFLLISSASVAFAARFSYSPSSGTLSGSSQIRVVLDSEGAIVDSATAVITFDPNRVEIESVTAGSFFDNINTDTSKSGEVAIIGYMNAGNIGKNLSDTMATITMKPKVTSGTITLGYRCSAADPDDSNIMNADNVNLLATDEQCGRNVAGSYTVGSSSGPAPTTSGSTTGSTTGSTNTSTTTSTTTSDTTTKGDQPVLPSELPQSGPANWLKWIVSGLAFIGIGLLLL